jgi:hypothetical protein
MLRSVFACLNSSSVMCSQGASQFQAIFFSSGYHPPGLTSNSQISLKGCKYFIASCGLIFLFCTFFQSALSIVPKTKYSLPIISGAFFSQIAIRSLCDFLPPINWRASSSCLMHSYDSSPYSSALLASHLSIKGIFENPSQNIHIEETRFPVCIPDRTSILMFNLIIYSHCVSIVKVFLL